MSAEVDLLREAATQMRTLAEAANTDDARRAYSPNYDIAVAALLERAADDYKTAWDTPECPSCADASCPPHERAEYHADGRCEAWVSECQCLAPFLTVAREFLRRERVGVDA